MNAVIARYKRDIDVTLIERNLKMTATERVAELQRLLAFSEELTRAGRALTPHR